MKKIVFIVLIFLSDCVIAQPVSQLPKKYQSEGLGLWFLVSDSVRGVGTTGVMSGHSADSLLFPNTTVTPGTYSLSTVTVDSKGRVTAVSSGTTAAAVTTTLSGAVTGTGTSAIVTSLGSFSSSNLATALTNETGSGQAVFNNGSTMGVTTFTDNMTVSANITYTPIVNSSLSGANARIPSHTTANMVFTNTALTSIASANNGGVSGGHLLFITNATGNTITMVNSYTAAAAGESINTGKGGDVSVPSGGSFALQYNATNSVWSFLGGGSTPVTNVTGKTTTGSGLPYTLCFAASDETTALAVDTNAVNMWLPESFTVTSVWCSLNAPQTSGSIFTVDAKLNGTSIFSTKPTIDNNEYNTGTAATASVLSTTAFGSGIRLSIYKQQIGNGTAKGLKVCFLGTR